MACPWRDFSFHFSLTDGVERCIDGCVKNAAAIIQALSEFMWKASSMSKGTERKQQGLDAGIEAVDGISASAVKLMRGSGRGILRRVTSATENLAAPLRNLK